MSKQTPILEATTRERTGSRYSQRLRAAGKLPAVMYGHGKQPTSISLDEQETLRHLHGGAHVVEIRLDDAKSNETCLVKDLQFGWLGDNVVHVDLTRVDLDEFVTVNVKINFTGTPASSKEAGMILTYDMTELEVSCKVRDIPEEIPVDIGSMEESFTVSEITLPDKVEAVAGPDELVCHLVFKAEEEEEPVLAEGEEGEAAEAAGDGEAASPAQESTESPAGDGGESEG